jgi:hypothetical protein
MFTADGQANAAFVYPLIVAGQHELSFDPLAKRPGLGAGEPPRRLVGGGRFPDRHRPGSSRTVEEAFRGKPSLMIGYSLLPTTGYSWRPPKEKEWPESRTEPSGRRRRRTAMLTSVALSFSTWRDRGAYCIDLRLSLIGANGSGR